MALIWPAGFGESDECRGIGGGWISVAPKNDTTEVWIRFSPDGLNWSHPPIFAVNYGVTQQDSFHVHYDGLYLWIENGFDRIWRSTKYGAAGSFVAH